MNLKTYTLALGAAFCLSISPACADSLKDIETISKAVGFINGGPSGDVTMDILYDPRNLDSATHAEEIARFSRGVGRKVKLTGRKVFSTDALSSPVIFITRGASSMYSAALKKAASNHSITVSTDEACLGIGCVLVIKTQPSVDIILSTEAAEKTGITFASAFSMMITKK